MKICATKAVLDAENQVLGWVKQKGKGAVGGVPVKDHDVWMLSLLLDTLAFLKSMQARAQSAQPL